MNIKKELPGVRENVLLKNYTTFRIGGKAKYFFVAKNKKDIIKAVLAARKFKLPFFILGGGSNLLVSDKGYNGLVIKVKSQKSKVKNNQIFCEVGVPLAKLVQISIKNNLTGLEWAVGIPGTVGGAIVGNAGAFGKSMGDITKTVTVLEIKNQKFKIKNLRDGDCKFGYRDSVFKHNKNLIILSAKIQLKKGKKLEIQRKIKEYLNYRKKTQPLNFPSAGSIFKNPEGFLAAKLIENSNLKGKRIGDVKISEKHANFIVNLGKGKAMDVKKLIDFARKKVKEKFKITLEEEITILS